MTFPSRIANRVPFIVVGFLAVASVTPAPAATWSRSFSRAAGGENTTSVLRAADGGIIVVGSDALGTSVIVAAIAPDGAPLWSTTLSAGGGHFIPNGATLTADGGVVVSATVGSDPDEETVLAKLDSAGSVVWQQEISAPGSNHLYGLVEAANGEILSVGQFQPNSSPFAGWIVRLTATGSVLWSRIVTLAHDDLFLADVTAADGGDFVAVGTTATTAPRNGDILAIRFDANGNLVWNVTFGDRLNDGGNRLTRLSGGDFALVGTTTLAGSPCVGNPFVARFDGNGNVVWQETVITPVAQCSEYPMDVAPSGDGGLAWSGLESHSDNSEVGTIVALTAAGAPVWKVRNLDQRRIPGLQAGPAGGYVSGGIADAGFVISVLGSNGLVAANCPNVTTEIPSVAPFKPKPRHVNLMQASAPVSAQSFSASALAMSLTYLERCSGP
jgi:hypothetical protein